MVTIVLPFCMVAAFTLSREGSLERFRPRRPLRSRSRLSCHPERSEGSAFRLSTLHAPSVSAFSSSDVCPFNFKLSSACPEHSRRVNFPPLTPFPATLTSHLQLAENKTTLSPAVATLTSRVKPKSFACHSYKKPWGRGYLLQAKIFSFGNLTTNNSPLSTISFTIRTYEKHTHNPFGIRTSKTQHLKPFRMNTYKKTGRGAHIFQPKVFSFFSMRAGPEHRRSERASGASEPLFRSGVSRATGHRSRATDRGSRATSSPLNAQSCSR